MVELFVEVEDCVRTECDVGHGGKVQRSVFVRLKQHLQFFLMGETDR